MSAVPKRQPKRGRPSTFSQAIADQICADVANGLSLRTACAGKNMPAVPTVILWLSKPEHRHFAERYARSREERYDAMAEECLAIADDGRNDWMADNDPENPGYRANGEHIHRSRLRVDTRKWFLSKLSPKTYGDKPNLTMDGQTLEAMLQAIEERKRLRLAKPAGEVIEGECVEVEPERSE